MGLVKAPEGGIMGVYSLSERAPVKTAQFRLTDKAFNDKSKYSEWQFSYVPAPLAGVGAAPRGGLPAPPPVGGSSAGTGVTQPVPSGSNPSLNPR